MRSYTNPSESGTVMQTTMGQTDPMSAVVDRVMMIAKRVVAAEEVSRKQQLEIDALKETNELLKTKIENLVLRSEGKEFKKPPTPRTRKTTPKKTTEE